MDEDALRQMIAEQKGKPPSERWAHASMPPLEYAVVRACNLLRMHARTPPYVLPPALAADVLDGLERAWVEHEDHGTSS